MWQGKHRDGETGVLMKTDATMLERAIARLEALHPYETPAILGWRCDATTPATAAWLGGLTR
jgi:periplasmic divalent cation tolerance protein